MYRVASEPDAFDSVKALGGRFGTRDYVGHAVEEQPM